MIDESRPTKRSRPPQHTEPGRNARSRSSSAWLAACGAALTLACSAARPEIGLPRPRASFEPAPEAATTLVSEAPVEAAGAVGGDIRSLSGSPEDLDLGRVVVYLDPQGATAAAAVRPEDGSPPIRVVSRGASFAPPLVAVPRGRRVVLGNDGPLNHRLFASDLGPGRAFELPPGGRSAPFRLPPIGPIRFYCSLHADETFILFAPPTPYVAVVERGERFSFGSVDPGRYTLSIWNERVEGPVRDVLVDGYSHRYEPIWIDPRLVRRADQAPRTRP